MTHIEPLSIIATRSLRRILQRRFTDWLSGVLGGIGISGAFWIYLLYVGAVQCRVPT